MKTISFVGIFVLMLVLSCTYRPKEEAKTETQDTDKKDSILVVQKPFESSPNVIEYEIPVIRGTQMKHGVQKRFYKHGSLYSTIPYSFGIREGVAFTYYPAAEGVKPMVWKEQSYKKNKLDGICKRYHKDGTLQAEYEYKDGMQAVGLKEYTQSGKEIKLPTLNLTRNRVHSGILITANLSNNSKKVNYYLGPLVDGKFLPKGLKALQVKNGEGQIIYKGNNKQVTITAVYSTRYRNKYLVSKTISL